MFTPRYLKHLWNVVTLLWRADAKCQFEFIKRRAQKLTSENCNATGVLRAAFAGACRYPDANITFLFIHSLYVTASRWLTLRSEQLWDYQ